MCVGRYGGKPAIMRARCWCFALCEDSGVQYYVCYFGDIWTLIVEIWKYLVGEIIFVKPPYKMAQFKKTYQKRRCSLYRKNLSDNANLWQSCNGIRGIHVLSVCIWRYV